MGAFPAGEHRQYVHASRVKYPVHIMELRIGIKHSPRELSFETAQSSAEVEELVTRAISNDDKLVRFVDDKERAYLVKTDDILYVELGTDQTRRVGFIA